eukprot:3610816-Pleurochrysis_carterae.AAC.1
MYSAPASRAAESNAAVRRTISLASASSCGVRRARWARREDARARVRTTGGPPSGDAAER